VIQEKGTDQRFRYRIMTCAEFGGRSLSEGTNLLADEYGPDSGEAGEMYGLYAAASLT
jgi:hypothetical protein